MRFDRDHRARQVFDELLRQGWTVTIKEHVKAIPPDRSMPIVICGTSPSDWRWFKNWIAELRRSGFRWPPE